MRILLTWARSILVLLALSGTAYADTTVSQSNDPTASVDTRLSMLLGQEHTAFTAVASTRLQAITTPVARAGAAPDDAAKAVQYSDTWLAELPVATGDQQWSCLAHAIYFEARGESVKGEFAVAEVIVERQSYEKAGKIARLILDGAPRVLTDGATYFHTVNVRPDWSYRFEETAAIGAHMFYRAPIQLASN